MRIFDRPGGVRGFPDAPDTAKSQMNQKRKTTLQQCGLIVKGCRDKIKRMFN